MGGCEAPLRAAVRKVAHGLAQLEVVPRSFFGCANGLTLFDHLLCLQDVFAWGAQWRCAPSLSLVRPLAADCLPHRASGDDDSGLRL